MNIVLDTNCLLMSLSRRSRYYPVWRDFVDGKYTLCITNEILAEYEEILTQKVGPEIASNVIRPYSTCPTPRWFKFTTIFVRLLQTQMTISLWTAPSKPMQNTSSPKTIITMFSSRFHSLVLTSWILTSSLVFCDEAPIPSYFFPSLPDDIEQAIEAKANIKNW